MRSEEQVHRALLLYADTVRRICFLHLCNRSDVEDVFQEVFLKYTLHNGGFESDAHEKAWLIRVTVNACKDLLKSFYRRMVRSLDDAYPGPASFPEESREVLDAVLRLPSKYRDVIYLHYYEGYRAGEIAAILGIKENTVYTWLARARNLLKSQLGGEPLEVFDANGV